MPTGPDNVARALGAAGLLLGIGNFAWTVTRTRRKLTVKARFIEMSPSDPGFLLGVEITARNPRKVPIDLKRVCLNTWSKQGGLLGFTRALSAVQGALHEEGAELPPQLFDVPPGTTKVKAYAVDSHNRRWHAGRIRNRRAFWRWANAGSKGKAKRGPITLSD